MPNSRLDAVRAWLTRTFAGRLLIAGVVLKLVAWVGLLTQLRPGLFGAIDTLGGLSILVSALAIGYRVYVVARHRPSSATHTGLGGPSATVPTRAMGPPLWFGADRLRAGGAS